MPLKNWIGSRRTGIIPVMPDEGNDPITTLTLHSRDRMPRPVWLMCLGPVTHELRPTMSTRLRRSVPLTTDAAKNRHRRSVLKKPSVNVDVDEDAPEDHRENRLVTDVLQERRPLRRRNVTRRIQVLAVEVVLASVPLIGRRQLNT